MKETKLETITNLFKGKEIRSIWDEDKEDYYFSVVDVIATLTKSNIPRNYWSDLKRKLKSEGSELHENIVQLKMKASDGKMRQTDTLDTKGILRLIESVPSPNAEPFKMWLASLGSERIDEVFDPEIAIKRAINYYRHRDYDDKWIEVLLTDIGEITTRELAKEHKPYGLEQNKEIATLDGQIAHNTRKDIETKLGKTVISKSNSLNYQYIDDLPKIET
ncbi:MAG: hypothetical protein IJ509_02550 [Bacilli bacterium]|nr:hypothetical protein [Bacilli bacterium]